MTKTTLRSQIIRLAHENPELRAELLPLLKEAGCEKLPEGGMRDNCEKKKEEGKSDKTAATAAVRKTVILIVRVLRAETLPPAPDMVESGYTDTNIWGQITIDFGGGTSNPDAVRFKAQVTQDPEGRFTVYEFVPVKTVSGGGAELLIGVLRSALQEALNVRGESLIRGSGP